MKILFVITDLRVGGAEKVCLNLANELVKKNEVTIAVLFKRGEFLNQLDKKIKVIDLKCSRIRFAFFKLIPVLFFINYNKIFVHCWPLTSIAIFSWLITFRKGKIYPMEQIHFSKEINQNLKISFFQFKFFIVLSHFFCSKIITVSKGVEDDLKKLCPILKKKIITIYNPVANKKIKFNLNKNNFFFRKNKKRALNCIIAGRLKEQKKINIAIKSFYYLKKNKLNAKLFILGEGEKKKFLESQIRYLNLSEHVFLLGQKTNIDLYFKNADLFILSSGWEGFGNVIVEAMSQSTPAICANCYSGPSEILNSGLKNFLTIVNNPRHLAQKIVSLNVLSKSVYFRKKFFQRSKDFTIEEISDQILEI